MSRPAFTYGMLFLVIAAGSALVGFGAVGSHAGDGGKVLAAVMLAAALLCFAVGWVFGRRAAARGTTARRWAAWSR